MLTQWLNDSSISRLTIIITSRHRLSSEVSRPTCTHLTIEWTTSFLHTGCSSWRPTDSVKALKAISVYLALFPGSVASPQNRTFGHRQSRLLTTRIIFLSTNQQYQNNKQNLTHWQRPGKNRFMIHQLIARQRMPHPFVIHRLIPQQGTSFHDLPTHFPGRDATSFQWSTSSTNLSPHRLPSSLRTDSTDFTTGPFLLSISVLCF